MDEKRKSKAKTVNTGTNFKSFKNFKPTEPAFFIISALILYLLMVYILGFKTNVFPKISA